MLVKLLARKGNPNTLDKGGEDNSAKSENQMTLYLDSGHLHLLLFQPEGMDAGTRLQEGKASHTDAAIMG